jgi:DNA polymerase-3 subunit delta'
VSWQRVKGHDDLVTAFARAVARCRLAHAYLFTGSLGVGKRLFAIELAKTLLCESPPADRFDSCDRCASCRLVDAGTHPDVFVVARNEEKNDVVIDDVRRLSENLSMKPARGGRKIAILDDADDLNEQSANCFLKTLEEPPPQSLLILIGTSAEQQLPTIRSRCQVVPFAALSESTVRALLAADEELDAETVARLARLGDGSPGLARELADQDLWSFRREILEALSKPNPDSPKIAGRLRELVEQAGKESGQQRRRAALVVRLLVDGFRRALARSVNPAAVGDDTTDGKAIARVAEKLDPDQLLRRIERCLEADTQIDRKVQLVLVLEGLVDALVHG